MILSRSLQNKKDMKSASDDELASANKFINKRWYAILFVRHANAANNGQPNPFLPIIVFDFTQRRSQTFLLPAS